MFSEVVNALYLTYLATEYNIDTNLHSIKKSRRSSARSDHQHHHHHELQPPPQTITTVGIGRHRRLGVTTIVVILWNMLDYISGFGDFVHHFLDIIFLYHIPRIALVAVFYIVTLYYDCRGAVPRHNTPPHVPPPPPMASILSWKTFLPRVFRYFLRILPIYPIMAVLISFIFLFVITIFEMLNLSTDILNAPIYYGTLYGPFSYIYYHVKQDIITEHSQSNTSFLPQHTVHATVSTTLV